MAQHPTYMTVTFSQTAPISGGYHELLIDLSGSYSLPSYNTAYPPCWFCGNFTKQYANAIVNQYGTFDLYVSFYILTFFGETSKSIGIAMYGASLNAGDTGDRRAGLYQFSVATGVPINIQTQSCIGTFLYPNQQQPFTSCDGNSHQASRFGWTTAEPLNGNQYRIAPNSNSVVCGSFSWSKA
jgi:hypothetical protein